MDFPKSRLFEQLSAIEHERWSDWEKYEFSICKDGTLIIPAWAVREWQRQIDTSYENLTEDEKNGDRAQVMRYWGA